jgi:hypothetical protein
MASGIPILSDIFGKKPDIVPFKPIDFGLSQIKSITENLAAFPKIQQLGSLFQDYMTSAYNKAIPNFSALLEMGGKTTEDILKAAGPLLRGEIPEDVKAQVLRTGAYQSLLAGGGPAFLHGLQARDIGRTSLDMLSTGANLVGAGASAAQRWAGLASGLIMNPAGFLITPKDQANLDLQQTLIKRQVAQERANLAAAPNPIAKGLSDLVAYLTASYIGHGAAGQPPKAPTYDTGGVANAAALNAGGVAQFTNQYGTSTVGPVDMGGGFAPGGGDFGGGGGGSAFPVSGGGGGGGLTLDQINQMNLKPEYGTIDPGVPSFVTPTDWNPNPQYVPTIPGNPWGGPPSNIFGGIL